MSTQPLDPAEVQAFLDALDEAGEKLRELIDAEDTAGLPAMQYYLDGSVFLEAGYLMVEHLGERFPDVYRALHGHYLPAFERAERGQINWGEALEALPEFLREAATDHVHDELAQEDG